MAYKREQVKERFRPKPGRLLDQAGGGNAVSSLRNSDRTNVCKMDIG